MRTYFFFLLSAFLFGGMIPSVQADPIHDDLCAREIPLFTESEYKTPCSDTATTAQTIAKAVLTKEMTDFQTEELTQLLQDNGSNGHFIAQESIRKLRRHESCLRKICTDWFDHCATKTKKNLGKDNADQISWCSGKVEQLSDIARTELFIVTTQNQNRKNRSLLSEKFRQISTRFRYYLHHWMSVTITDLNFFKGKVDATVRQPKY